MFSFKARNYAIEHSNKIHSDETALRYGFTGALVPGVAIYAYLVEPVVSEWHEKWITGGEASIKLLKPIYDGADVSVRIAPGSERVPSVKVELFDPTGVLSAVGEASLPDSRIHVTAADYPSAQLPAPGAKRPPTADSVPAGELLGSVETRFDLAELTRNFSLTVCHPAFLLAQANEIIASNVELGPWIHTASQVKHVDVLDDGELCSLRGRIAESGLKRGHDFVVVDLAMFGKDERLIATIKHSALIRLREAAPSGEA